MRPLIHQFHVITINIVEILIDFQSGFTSNGIDADVAPIQSKLKLSIFKTGPPTFRILQERIKGTEKASPIHTLFRR